MSTNKKEYDRAYYHKNKEKILVRQKVYREAHKPEMQDYQEQYRARNKYICSVWHSYYHMLRRCYNPKHKQFRDYGGRGIAVCERWLGKEGRKNFISDMGTKPEGYTLERKDNNGNYTPENCAWVSRTEQQRNRRNNVYVEYNGERMLALKAAELSGVAYATLMDRVRKGWTGDKLFAPSLKTKRKEILEQEVEPNWDHHHRHHQTHIKSRMPKLRRILQQLGLMRS